MSHAILDPHVRRNKPPTPLMLERAATPRYGWSALLAELRASEPKMLDPAVDARRDAIIELIQAEGPEWAEDLMLGDLRALGVRVAAGAWRKARAL